MKTELSLTSGGKRSMQSSRKGVKIFLSDDNRDVIRKNFGAKVIKVVRKLILEDERLLEYSKMYSDAVNKSLDKVEDVSGIQSFVSHVNKLPTGKEMGKFLSLDFSGPEVTIILLNAKDGVYDVTVQKFEIPKRLMTGKSERLFDFLAKCLSDFIKTVDLKKMARIPLGVTFGFPIEQISLQKCILLRWTKGFDCKDMVGRNVFTKFKDSIRKFPDLKRVFIIGILNETISVLLSGTTQNPLCKIALVIGQVANCCYTEKVSRIRKYEAQSFGEKIMYINLESGEFGDDGSLTDYRTEFDLEMDENTKTKGRLINEKLTGMSYFGEIARLAIVRCIRQGLILSSVVTPQIEKKNSFSFEHMMRIESDSQDGDSTHHNCLEVLSEFGYEPKNVVLNHCFQIQFICRCVSRRAAHLMAAQTVALMNRINERNIAIVLDGQMVNSYPGFEYYLTKKIRQLKKESIDFQIVKLKPNGAAIGAGVMASVFAEEVMNRDEKLRRLPGFPMSRCHFRQCGMCMNPNCGAKTTDPCTETKETEKEESEPCFTQLHCPKKNLCCGYDRF